MVSKEQLALEELMFVGHVRDRNQNQVLPHPHAEAVEGKVFKQYDKDHLWYSKYVVIVMELVK